MATMFDLLEIAPVAVTPIAALHGKNLRLDPVQLSATAISATTDISLSPAELIGPSAPNGVIVSKGTNNAFIGYISGLTVHFPVDVTAAQVKDALAKIGIQIDSGAQQRFVPLSECLRIQPHGFASTSVGTCGPGGTPARELPVPVLWEGLGANQIQIVASAALTAPTDFTVSLFGAWIMGDPSSVRVCGTDNKAGLNWRQQRAMTAAHAAALRIS